ncbi:MAG: Ku protein [Spirochaetales bacterium]
MWSGTISFGLVSVPVSLFSALRSRPTHLRMMSRDGEPLRRRYICPEEGKPLDRDEIVRGYETDDGKMILVEDDELEALAPEKANDIGLAAFVDLHEIPDFHFDRPYFLAPSGGSSKAYQLLAHVMQERGKAGIGRFVMRGKEYLVAIVAQNGILMAETLRFADEVRDTDRVPLPDRESPSKEERKRIKSALSSISRKTLKKDDLEDRYAERLQAVIEKKQQADEGTVEVEMQEDEASEEGRVIDLVEIFRERMRQAEEGDESESG